MCILTTQRTTFNEIKRYHLTSSFSLRFHKRLSEKALKAWCGRKSAKLSTNLCPLMRVKLVILIIIIATKDIC